MTAGFSYGSVCSGIEAASVAWHVFGWRAAWFAEVEPNPSAVLAHRWPDVPNLGDMTLIARYVRAGYVEAPDVLVGGTPCQAFSVAGLRGGLTDARGQLTLTYVDLANAIDEKRGTGNECVIYWENVPGVLSDATNAFGCLLGALAGEDGPLINAGGKWSNAGIVVGPQRAIAWRVLDAQYFGVAQRRRRVFVVASARNGFDPAAILFESEGVRRDSAPRRSTGQETAAGTLRSTDGGSDVDHARAGHVIASPVCPTLRAGGNSTGGDRPPGTDVATADSLIVHPIAFGGNNTAGSIDIATACRAHASPHYDFESETFLVQPALSVALRGREGGATAELGDEVAGCLRASGGGGDKAHVLAPTSYAIQAGALRTNPLSGPDGIGVQANIAYTLEARAEVQAVCVTGDIAHTLKAEGFDASEDGTGRGQPIVACVHADAVGRTGEAITPSADAEGRVRLRNPGLGIIEDGTAYNLMATGQPHAVSTGMAVRRLTPRECERLQGFPDDYTLVPMPERRATPREGGPRMMADGPRYKALGNSMAVPCMRWLGMRLMVTHPEYFY